MAALEPAAPRNTGKNQRSASAKPRARKRSFRLDMTPMVDLAFLLLTFFMLTTTFAKSRVMQLTMPVDDHSHTTDDVPSSHAMTVILGSAHRVYYYTGLYAPADPRVPVPALHTTDFSDQGIRQALLTRGRQQPKPIILIKAGPHAKYQDMVDILDEMNITDQRKYAVTELSAADRQLLPASERQ